MVMISILAANFAYEKHKRQRRKYTGEPYINHCLEVVALVACVTSDKSMISAAFLHDTVEDCGVTFKEIQELFGLVRMVSCSSDTFCGQDAVQ